MFVISPLNVIPPWEVSECTSWQYCRITASIWRHPVPRAEPQASISPPRRNPFVLQYLHDGQFGIISHRNMSSMKTTHSSALTRAAAVLVWRASYRGNSSHTSSTTPLAIIVVLHHDQGTRPARRRGPMTTNPGTEPRVHVLSSPRSTAVDDTETKILYPINKKFGYSYDIMYW